MKKVLIILFSIICVGIVGFFGYTIYKSNSIDSIEIVGDVQTIYFASSVTQDINFNDAELKITYKNGDIKILKMNKKNVSVKGFDTSISKKGTATIVYKGLTLDVGYSVISEGLYYMSNKTETKLQSSSTVSTTNQQYTAGLNASGKDTTTAVEMIYFYGDGRCDYYSRSSSSETWIMNDSAYDDLYRYELKGDTIVVNLGNKKIYNMNIEIDDQSKMVLKFTDNEYLKNNGITTDFISKQTSYTFSFCDSMERQRTLNNSHELTDSDYKYSFSRGSNYANNGTTIYLDVEYINTPFLNKVKVVFNESMLYPKQTFVTSTAGTRFVQGVYKNKVFRISYQVN